MHINTVAKKRTFMRRLVAFVLASAVAAVFCFGEAVAAVFCFVANDVPARFCSETVHAASAGESTDDEHVTFYGEPQDDAQSQSVAALRKLGSLAVTLSKSVADIVNVTVKGEISREEVYRLKTGTRLTGKKIKKEGGSKRFFHIYKIKKGDRVFKKINGKSYRENPNIALSDLRYVKTLYHDFDGKVRVGELIVNKSIAKDIKEIFIELYKMKYQIRKMRLIDNYYTKGGSGTAADEASMNDDNTSAFNYRVVAGTSTISMHGYGRAIDINPFENPWCPGGKLYPNQSKSAAYANRGVNSGERKPHMIFQDSKITKLFKEHGFRWLGETGTRDYQHFEK